MNQILLDTDVILDFFFDRKPFSDSAAKILALSESKIITVYVTSVIISNVYYLLRKTATHKTVIEKLNQLISITRVLTTDKTTIKLALNSEFNDFEDALQNFSAETNGDIDLILTRNYKDYKHSSLSVMTPADFLKIQSL